MIIHKLLKSQKNNIFEILRVAGLEPANFSWIDSVLQSTDRVTPRLKYLDGEYYFRFDMFESEHYCKFSPGEEKIVQWEKSGFWEKQIHYVRVWIRCLKREIDAPDLWAEMEKYKTSVSIALPEQLLNEPIQANEAEKISEQLSSLADKIEKQFELTNEQNQFVRSKLNYLAEAAKRQRSMDWAHTLIGVSVTIAMGLALAPEQAKELWELMRRLGELIHLFGP